MNQKIQKESKELVSIVALSYNSEKTIIQTLESIKNQTHPRIELILCDDGSIDNSRSVITSWISENKEKIESIKTIFHERNVGIVKNHQSGLSIASGSWIKPIACDDILEEDAISEFLAEAEEKKEDWIFSQCTKFTEKDSKTLFLGTLVSKDKTQKIKTLNTAEIKKILLTDNILPAPGSFFSRNLIELCNGLDHRFTHLDDWPLWLRALNSGHKPHWIEKPLVRYRLSPSSISQSEKNLAFSPLIFEDLLTFRKIYSYPELSITNKWHLRLQSFRSILCFRYFGNKKIWFDLTLPILALSPIAWKRIITS